MKRLLCEEKIAIPDGCAVEIKKKVLTVTGTRATETRDLSHFVLSFSIEGDTIFVRLWNGTSRERSKLKTCASLVRNCIRGCMQGYAYTLKAVYSHFPVTIGIEQDGRVVAIKNFIGQKAVKRYRMRGDSRARLGDEKDTFVVEGPSLEDVSQSAGTIQENCQARDFDSRVFLDGIYFLRRGVITGE